MHSQTPNRDQSSQKSHFYWRAPAIETNRHWR
jgi:hypothetical protein